MDLIKEIVQNILIIILLNVLLEMLMPKSDMSRYIKLVMGLFIIAAVLNPVLRFMNEDISIMAIQVPGGQAEELASLIGKGKALGEQKKKAAVGDLEEKISQQVLALVRLDGKTKVQKVVVEAEENPEKADFGSIKSILLHIPDHSPEEQSKGKVDVKPVEINVNSTKTEAMDSQGQPEQPELINLRRVLADFYGISPDSITIVQGKK